MTQREISEYSIEITSSIMEYMREGSYTNVLNEVYNTLSRVNLEGERAREVEGER